MYHKSFEKWLKAQGWQAFDFQKRTWRAIAEGKSGLIHASTGAGKTYALWGGAIADYLQNAAPPATKTSRANAEPVRVLWITPLRALAADTVKALQKPVTELGLPWSVEKRTGDTSSSLRAKQARKLPSALVTTPESLALLLTYPNVKQRFSSLRMVVMDEWHELLGSKRGVLAELNLARLRRLLPQLTIWGLSATLGNTDQAMRVLLGSSQKNGILVRGATSKRTNIECIIPPKIERFPWAGHLGLSLLKQVVERIEPSKSCLLFTNTRSQTETWYRALLEARPDWAGLLGLHHGSLERDKRDAVEKLLAAGKLKCVVATSSLDLGVDFTPVDLVMQVGSPKGIARLLQRAGRSGHQPGVASHIVCVPTNALELIEISAARRAAAKQVIEPRNALRGSIDVLVQHIVNSALGDGCDKETLLEEIRSTHAFSELSQTEWQWALDFVTRGGPALRAYPEYRRVDVRNNKLHVKDKQIIRRQRMSLGTITSDSMLTVKFISGGSLGHIEEQFISRLQKGDRFTFAGRLLEFVNIKDMVVRVRRVRSGQGVVPRWMGGRMPLSSQLADAFCAELTHFQKKTTFSAEMEAVAPLLFLQQRWSRLPQQNELLIEWQRSREGQHLFVYPFAGFMVHEGLGALLAYRLAQKQPLTFSVSVNDYGFELLSDQHYEVTTDIIRDVLQMRDLENDILAGLNASEMGRRQFREIARVAGLVFQGYPGKPKSARQLQAGSSLFYDVFDTYDPKNMLLLQARREVLEHQLEKTRLVNVLERVSQQSIVLCQTPRFTPLAFPILVNRLRARVSSEKLADRVQRLQRRLEKAAGV